MALENLQATEWAAAVVSRHSSRTYTGLPAEPDILRHMEQFLQGLPGRSAARAVVVENVPERVFTGFLGGYGRVVGARSALVVIGTLSDPTVQESVGYLGGAAVLEATSLGLDTCWVAGFFDRRLAETIVELSPAERVMALSPLGYAMPKPRTGERLMKRVVGARGRRPIQEVAPGFDEDRWPAWAAEGARLARLAPSAVNRQPWSIRLLTEADSDIRPPRVAAAVIAEVRRGVEGGISRRLDCGIAMLHFEVGARLMRQSGRWEVLAHPDVARYVIAEGN